MLRDLQEQIMDKKHGARPTTEYWVRFCQDCIHEKDCRHGNSIFQHTEIILCAISKLTQRLG
jgi:hypothetical protein